MLSSAVRVLKALPRLLLLRLPRLVGGPLLAYALGAATAAAAANRARRRDADHHVARFLAGLRDIRDIHERERVPSWCRDPGYDRLTSVTTLLRAVWPALRAYLASTVQLDAFNQSLASYDYGDSVREVKILTLDVGSEPPAILGVRAATGTNVPRAFAPPDDTEEDTRAEADDVLVEIDLRWNPGAAMRVRAGASIAVPALPTLTSSLSSKDPSAPTEAPDDEGLSKDAVGPEPEGPSSQAQASTLDVTAGISNVALAAVVQLELTGALPHPPFFTDMRISFARQPKLDFSVSVMGAHVSLVPLLEQALVNAVSSSLAAYVWPNGYDYKLAEPVVPPPPEPLIAVRVHSVRDVRRSDFFSENDLFVSAQIETVLVKEELDGAEEGKTLDEAMELTGEAIRHAHARAAQEPVSPFGTRKKPHDLLATKDDDPCLPYGAQLQSLRPLRLSTPGESLNGIAASTSVVMDTDAPDWDDDEPSLLLRVPRTRIVESGSKCLNLLQLSVLDADLFGSATLLGYAILPLADIRRSVANAEGDSAGAVTLTCPLLPPELTANLVERLRREHMGEKVPARLLSSTRKAASLAKALGPPRKPPKKTTYGRLLAYLGMEEAAADSGDTSGLAERDKRHALAAGDAVGSVRVSIYIAEEEG